MRDNSNANNNIALDIIKKHIVPQLTVDNISKIIVASLPLQPGLKFPLVGIQAAASAYLKGESGILSSAGLGVGAVLDYAAGPIYKKLLSNENIATDQTTAISNTTDTLNNSVYIDYSFIMLNCFTALAMKELNMAKDITRGTMAVYPGIEETSVSLRDYATFLTTKGLNKGLNMVKDTMTTKIAISPFIEGFKSSFYLGDYVTSDSIVDRFKYGMGKGMDNIFFGLNKKIKPVVPDVFLKFYDQLLHKVPLPNKAEEWSTYLENHPELANNIEEERKKYNEFKSENEQRNLNRSNQLIGNSFKILNVVTPSPVSLHYLALERNDNLKYDISDEKYKSKLLGDLWKINIATNPNLANDPKMQLKMFEYLKEQLSTNNTSMKHFKYSINDLVNDTNQRTELIGEMWRHKCSGNPSLLIQSKRSKAEFQQMIQSLVDNKAISITPLEPLEWVDMDSVLKYINSTKNVNIELAIKDKIKNYTVERIIDHYPTFEEITYKLELGKIHDKNLTESVAELWKCHIKLEGMPDNPAEYSKKYREFIEPLIESGILMHGKGLYRKFVNGIINSVNKKLGYETIKAPDIQDVLECMDKSPIELILDFWDKKYSNIKLDKDRRRIHSACEELIAKAIESDIFTAEKAPKAHEVFDAIMAKNKNSARGLA